MSDHDAPPVLAAAHIVDAAPAPQMTGRRPFVSETADPNAQVDPSDLQLRHPDLETGLLTGPAKRSAADSGSSSSIAETVSVSLSAV